MNAADPAATTGVKRKRRLEKDQLSADVERVMGTPAGRRVVFHVIDSICNTHGGSYVESPTRTAFNEGKRHAGIELRELVKRLAPLDYVHMLNEQFTSSTDAKASSEAG